MVQVISMRPAQSGAAAAGEGFYKGFSSGLNAQLQDMMYQKQLMRQSEANEAINQKSFKIKSPLPPNILAQILMQQSELSGHPIPGFGPMVENANQPINGNVVQQELQPKRTLPFGMPPMLEIQDVPAAGRGIVSNASNLPQVKQPPPIMGKSQDDMVEAMNREIEEVSDRYRKEKMGLGKGGKLYSQLTSKENSEINQIIQKYRTQAGLEKNKAALSKQEWDKKQKIIDREEAKTKKYREDMGLREESLAKRKQAIEMSREAVERGNVEPFSLGHIASILGVPEAAGTNAAEMMAGNKIHLLAALAPIGGRYNVYLEQQMTGAYPMVGRSKAGNLIAIDAADAQYKTDEAYLDAYHLISDKYDKDPNYGYFPEKAKAEVEKLVKPRLKNIRNEMFLKFQEDRESDEPVERMAQHIEKQMHKTPLTHKRAVAIMTKAKNDLTRALNREPNEDEVVNYFEQLVRDNNYFRVEEQ